MSRYQDRQMTPSPSVSFCKSAHPFASTVAPSGVLGHVSRSSMTPSPSVSFCQSEHPFASTEAPSGTS